MTFLRPVLRPSTAALLLMFGVGGCYQGVDDFNDDVGADGAGTAADGDGGDDGAGPPASELPAPTTRFYRLTHEQWENTVRDLFYLADHTGLSSNFRLDPKTAGFIFDNNATSLEVDGALWSGYQRAAADAAALAVNNSAVMTAILPPDGGDDVARARQFVSEFGMRAYRRPLEDAEVDDLVAQFNAANYTGVDPFTGGVQMVIETVLQAPYFIYRVESSTEPDGNVIPLNSWEVASRLSYFLWNTMPDDALLAAASGDELASHTTVIEHARRMVDDPQAESVVQHFHDQMFEVDEFAAITPSPAFFPDVSDQLGEFAVEEHQRFVRDIVFAQDGGLADMLLSTDTFVNAELAEIYNLGGGFGAQFEKVALNATQRAGIFTQVGFLAHHASSVNPSPIHRGVFLAERMLCLTIAAPPDGVPPLPELMDQTNRELVEAHTEQPGTACVACHGGIINPLGFPFENYDAVGAWRDEDNGHPVDPVASPLVDGTATQVNSAVELAQALAGSADVHECYAQHLLEFSFGRHKAAEDHEIVERLGTASAVDAEPIREILVQLATSQPFLTRATEELP